MRLSILHARLFTMFLALFPLSGQAVETRLPTGTRVIADIAYGDDGKQRFDVYLPPHAVKAPVLFIVHGGAWRNGWKDHPGLISNKAFHWIPKGYVIVSTDYRLAPGADPLVQSQDVARAIAKAQQLSPSWGADPDRFILMGHSAGAHLAVLLGSDPALLASAGARPPRGIVSLDSGAIDVVEIMTSKRRLPLYDEAFGASPEFWQAVSPYHVLGKGAPPMLIVCSTRRRDACPPSWRFARKASTSGTRVEVMEQDLSHMAINRELGLPGDYTRQVDAFIERIIDQTSARAAFPFPFPGETGACRPWNPSCRSSFH